MKCLLIKQSKHHLGLLLCALLLGRGGASAQVRYSSVESSVTSLGPDAVKCIGPSAANPCIGALQTFTYDTNGNIETGNNSAGSTNFTYNHDNKLLRSTGPAHTVEYVYGPSGEKVATIENGVTTYFFENGLEVSAQGNSQSYLFNGERVAIKDTSSPTPRFLLSDHLGSVRAVVASSGDLISRNDYYPFGEMMSQTGNSSADSSYQFHGNRSDAGGVIDFNARSMMPGIGRFLQADTIIPDEKDPQSLNRYAYTQNNPLKFRDPSGHAVTPFDILLNFYGNDKTWRGANLMNSSDPEERERGQDLYARSFAESVSSSGAQAVSAGVISGMLGKASRLLSGIRLSPVRTPLLAKSSTLPVGEATYELGKALEALHPEVLFRGERSTKNIIQRVISGISAPGHNTDLAKHLRGSVIKLNKDSGLISMTDKAAVGVAYATRYGEGTGALYVIDKSASYFSVGNQVGEHLARYYIPRSKIIAAYEVSYSEKLGYGLTKMPLP